MDKLKSSQSMKMAARLSDGGYQTDSEGEGHSTLTLGSSTSGTHGSLHKRTRSLNRDEFDIGIPEAACPLCFVILGRG